MPNAGEQMRVQPPTPTFWVSEPRSQMLSPSLSLRAEDHSNHLSVTPGRAGCPERDDHSEDETVANSTVGPLVRSTSVKCDLSRRRREKGKRLAGGNMEKVLR